MPLRTGSSREDFKANLKQLRKEGKGKAQALAIALQKAGKSKKRPRNKAKKNLIAALRG